MLKALDEHYLGYGTYFHDITKAVNIMKNILYSGKKPPSMYWDEFERQMNWEFATYVKHNGIQTLNNEMKLKQLM